MGSSQPVANAQSLPRFRESTANPLSLESGLALLEPACPCKGNDSYASYSFGCHAVSMHSLQQSNPLPKSRPALTIEESSRHNECVYACRSHNLCVIWCGYEIVRSDLGIRLP